MKIAEYLIKRPRISHLTLALIVLMGVLTMASMRRQSDPAIDFDIMTVITVYPGASPEDVEINVTDPIEDELKSVEDVEELTSASMENVSLITINIDPNSSNIERVKSDIRDAVDRVTDLPAQVTDKPRVEEIRSSNMPVLEIAIFGDIPELTLRKHAKDLEDDLLTAKGVGLIEKVGYRKREVHVAADQAKLDDRYVSLNEIMNSIKGRNVRTTGGSLESYVSEKKIVTFAEYDDPMEVADVIIRSTFTGNRVRISDVAVVTEGFEEHSVIPRANGRNAITLIVKGQATADILTLSDNVKAKLDVLRTGLPDGVTAEIMYDNSVYTSSLLSLVRSNGLIGFVLVLVVMLLFLDRKSALWTAFGIPITICGAMIFFPLFDLTINQITLSSMILVLGMIVDNAIVISENVYRLKVEGMPPLEATIKGVKQVFAPIVASTLTTVLAFLPMLFMTGLIGKFIVGIPIVVLLMLMMSLVESTCFLPGHIVNAMPPKDVKEKKAGRMDRAIAWYREKLGWCLRNRKKVMAFYGVLFVIVIIASKLFLQLVLFPTNDPDMFYVIVETPRGTPLVQTAAKISEVEKIVSESVPEGALMSYLTRVGHHSTDQYSKQSGGHDNYAIVTVYLQPADERDIRSEEIIATVSNQLKLLQGYSKLHVQKPESGPPVGKPVNVVFISDDDGLRDKFERDAMKYLETVRGVHAVESDNVEGKDELRLKLDYDEMAKLGIIAIDVSRTVRAAFDGEVVTSIRKDGEEIDFRVLLKDRKDFRAEGVMGLMVVNNLGKLVPLGSFARFEESRGLVSIPHFDGRRSVTVSSEIDTKITTSTDVNAMLDEKFGERALKEPGFMMKLMGEQDKTQESMESFWMAMVVALVAIFFLLVVLFDSFIQPLLIMSAIPLGVIGVLLTFLFHGLPIGFIALIGILGLTGVVINTSIVMISTINDLVKERGVLTPDVIMDAAAIRFRPVMLTTVTTVAGLLPTAYGIGGNLPFIRPMVLAMAWGLVFATLISLIFIPLIYAMSERVKT
jgi:multidrug efflux pump subunit AcrB